MRDYTISFDNGEWDLFKAESDREAIIKACDLLSEQTNCKMINYIIREREGFQDNEYTLWNSDFHEKEDLKIEWYLLLTEVFGDFKK